MGLYGRELWPHEPYSATAKAWDDEERAALLALLRMQPKGARWSDVADAVATNGSARDVWHARYPAALLGGDEDAVLERARADVTKWRNAPFDFHTFMDDSYPEQLRSVHQMPPIVFTQGRRVPREVAVSVVGSRRASPEGVRFADGLARQLAEFDVTVVAGLAEGIDTVAHEAALRAGGRTVAVLGNGIERSYPANNRDLQQEIAKDGMLLSQFMPDFSPTKWSFPARNAVMSAYGLATVIVEATEVSGTRIQAREAVNHGRAVILSCRVVEATNWARRLIGEPGVYVANDVNEAIEQIGEVIEADAAVESILAGSGW